VSLRGEYVGARIAPGIEISVEALGARGAQLRKVELARPRSVIGKSTVEAMHPASSTGFAGQVDGIVDRMAVELSEDPDAVTVGPPAAWRRSCWGSPPASTSTSRG